jgi:hypothetical protein
VVSEPASQDLLWANGQAECDEEVSGGLFVTHGDRSKLSEIAPGILERNKAEHQGVFVMLNMSCRSIARVRPALAPGILVLPLNLIPIACPMTNSI